MDKLKLDQEVFMTTVLNDKLKYAGQWTKIRTINHNLYSDEISYTLDVDDGETHWDRDMLLTKEEYAENCKNQIEINIESIGKGETFINIYYKYKIFGQDREIKRNTSFPLINPINNIPYSPAQIKNLILIKIRKSLQYSLDDYKKELLGNHIIKLK